MVLVENEEPKNEKDDTEIDQGHQDEEEDGQGLVGDPQKGEFLAASDLRYVLHKIYKFY
jgi:hypothetical protein